MKMLFFLVGIVWLFRLLFNLFSYVHLWYVKEYRWDRMFIHLRTKQGKQILFIPWRKPPISPKTISLAVGSFIIMSLLLIFLPLPILLRFLTADLLLFPMTFLLVGIFRLPTLAYHAVKINQARAIFGQHDPMTVIGVTGSFGKTSTKEYLVTILSRKYKVLRTESSKNSAIGIAEVVLAHLRPEHQAFIVEMGAYKPGEIREMADMVKPEIGIVTAINAQHQDLFGTMETTMKAKYELIQGLGGKRMAIFNADNEYVQKIAEWAKKDGVEVWSVGRESGKIRAAKQYITIKNVKGDLNGISLELTLGKETAQVTAPVLGEHQATNISLAIAGAVAAGIPLSQAAKAARKIKSFAKTLESIPGINGSIYINDTFNNNPDAAKAALGVLAMAKGRKILVFQPMIELGSYTEESHKMVGVIAARVCDDIILTNSNFSEPFIDGVHSSNPEKKVAILSPTDTASFIRGTVKKGDAVLFKGKEAEHSFRLLISS